jgi:mannose-6-phosphate isomerase-like protein (cupin superfamily)
VSEPILVPLGGGEVIADSPERRVEILSDPDVLHATLSRYGPHRDGADLHVHHHHSDHFYVLEGELTVRLGPEDSVVVVPAGTLARVPPLVIHGFRNASDADVRYINLHAPGMDFANYLRAMRDRRPYSYDQHPPPEDGGRPLSEATVGDVSFVADRPSLRVALLADSEEIGISEAWSDPGGPPAPLHVHPRHVETFYVLAGEMAFTVGPGGTSRFPQTPSTGPHARTGGYAAGRELHAVAGSWVQIPAGVPHMFAFPGSEPVRFLNLHTPSCGYAAFLRGLHEARTDEDLEAVRARFDQIPA